MEYLIKLSLAVSSIEPLIPTNQMSLQIDIEYFVPSLSYPLVILFLF